jgi:hypothetical protein
MHTCQNYSQNHSPACRNHTRECQNYSRVCGNHTLRVKSHSAGGNCTLRVKIMRVVRVEITLVRFEITLVRIYISSLGRGWGLLLEESLRMFSLTCWEKSKNRFELSAPKLSKNP